MLDGAKARAGVPARKAQRAQVGQLHVYPANGGIAGFLVYHAQPQFVNPHFGAQVGAVGPFGVVNAHKYAFHFAQVRVAVHAIKPIANPLLIVLCGRSAGGLVPPIF